MCPVIANSLFKSIADRLAKQADILATACTQAQAPGGGLYYPRIHQGVAAAGNFPVENDLIDSANEFDANTLSGTIFPNIFTSMISAQESHVVAQKASSLDAFLNISGINVDPNYENAYFLCKGNHLNARNTFLDRQAAMGTVDLTSSGVGTFTDGEAIGTGTGKTSDTNHAAAELDAIPMVTIGANNLVLAVQLLAEIYPDGSVAASRNVTIPTGTTSGVPTQVGSAGEAFLDITNVILAGGNASDQVVFVSRKERTRAL